MNPDVPTRRKAIKPDIEDRELCGALEPVDEVEIFTKPDPPPVFVPERDELGTIPKPYTYDDACAVVIRIGLDKWQALGYHGKLFELKSRR